MEMKIYTKQGDKGGTGLLGGHKVKKNHERLEAYGSIDELNSWVGMIRSYPTPEKTLSTLIQIQRRLFMIGSYLAYDAQNAINPVSDLPMITDNHVACLEQEIDRMNENLPDLTNFIMPGGDPQSGACHLARTVCRRAERRIVALCDSLEINSVIIRYINRLSDYFFVLARHLSKQNKTDEILWKNDI